MLSNGRDIWIYPRQIRLRKSIKESSKEAQKILFHKILMDKAIRDKAYKKFGPKKGYLSKAGEEAFRLWLKEGKGASS